MNSNDLLKRIDEWLASCKDGAPSALESYRIICDCKAALEAKGEPVAWLDLKKLSVGGMAYATSRNANSRQVPLYTTHPSVDALIAEIDGLPVHHFHEKTEKRFINLKSLDKAIDKYRSTK